MKKKKNYETPNIEIYKVQLANIIATSAQTQDLGYEEEYQW